MTSNQHLLKYAGTSHRRGPIHWLQPDISSHSYTHPMITSSDAEIAAWNEKVVQAKKDKAFLAAARRAQHAYAYANRKLAV